MKHPCWIKLTWVLMVILAITGLSASSTLAFQDVTLSWDANTEPDLAGYHVYFDTAGTEGEWTPVADDYPAKVEYSANGSTWTLTTVITGPPTYVKIEDTQAVQIKFTGLSDKVYEFAIAAYDGPKAGLDTVVSGLGALSDIVKTEDQPPDFTTFEVRDPQGSEFTNKTTVDLYIEASDTPDSRVTHYLIKEDETQPSVGDERWVGFPNGGSANVTLDTTFTLTAENGNKALHAWVKDVGQNITKSDTVIALVLDTIKPLSTIDSPANNSLLKALSLIEGTASDERSGVDAIQLRVTNSDETQYLVTATNTWANLLPGTDPWFTPSSAADPTDWAHNTASVPFQSYTTYTIRARAIDNAGNIQTETPSARFTFDNDPPGGSIFFNETDTSHIKGPSLTIFAKFDEDIQNSPEISITLTGNTPALNTTNIRMDGGPKDWQKTVDIPWQDRSAYTVGIGNVLDLAGNQPTAAITKVFTTDTIDTDGDTIRDFEDDNDDGDTWIDAFELNPDNCLPSGQCLDPLVNDEGGDLDGDGYTNIMEYNNGWPINNKGPDKPNITYPSSSEAAPFEGLKLTASVYADNESDAHTKTVWLIGAHNSPAPDTIIYKFETTKTKYLTSLPVPDGVLRAGSTYFVIVTYYDSHGGPSIPSDEVIFTTQTDLADDNNDGIPDESNIADWDITGDSNNDISSTFKAVTTAEGDTQAGVEALVNVTAINSLVSVRKDDIADDVNKPTTMPYGLLNFNISVVTGSTAKVKIHFLDPLPNGTIWYKYDSINGWQDYSDPLYSEISADRKSVILTLTDGDVGDADGVANGIITDPSGPGTAGSGAPLASSGGGGGGCFITTVISNLQAGHATEWPTEALIALAAMLAMALGSIALRRK